MSPFRENLRKLREAAGLTQESLAFRLRSGGCGVTTRTIARYEAGETSPSLVILDAIAGALGCSLVDLLAHEV